jgi:hypothetical protein
VTFLQDEPADRREVPRSGTVPGVLQVDYPGLFLTSDAAAIAAQRNHFQFLTVQLLVYFIASLSGALASAVHDGASQILLTVAALALALGVMLTWLARSRGDEKTWFDCRAIAESAKTMTWRYIMRAAPFDGDAVEASFLAELEKIRKARPGLEARLVATRLYKPMISAQMTATRAKPLAERLKVYLAERLVNQKSWYQNKCRANQRAASAWFWIAVMLQFGALAAAVVQLSVGRMNFDVVSVIMTVAASFMAWAQAKRFGDLVPRYALAAQELEDAEPAASLVSTENGLQQLVARVEEAISREHTMWLAGKAV